MMTETIRIPSHPEPEHEVKGIELDPCLRCLHYHGATDVVAIKMRCCDTWYACIDCHRELAGHPVHLWPSEQGHCRAVLCGVCDTELSIAAYMESGHRCPHCRAPFNPGCRNHYHLYFEVPAVSR